MKGEGTEGDDTQKDDVGCFDQIGTRSTTGEAKEQHANWCILRSECFNCFCFLQCIPAIIERNKRIKKILKRNIRRDR